MTLFYYDPLFLEHATGAGHPESARRIAPLAERMCDWASQGRLRRVAAWEAATHDEIELVHQRHYAMQIEMVASAGGGRVEQDTVVSPHSYEAALLAVGAACDAVRRVVQGEDTTAFCLVRPPGHHALEAAPMGFCLFNNVAIAARTALQSLGMNRVLIVDWDVHHGNGTQDMFWEDPQVAFFSAHRWPFYPGTGAADEKGQGAGAGATHNLPVKMGTPRGEYVARFTDELSEFAQAMRPDLVLLSAGFDAHSLDPVGSLGLESEDFSELTAAVRSVAAEHAEGRLVSVMEGGYHPTAVLESASCHLERLTGTP
ncbi:MAG: histone deacetylase [Planctomycetales bacterium]|nr:histone deacetylase [Planctomycetales bacterium]